MLIELACSTTLVPAYNPALFHILLPELTERSIVVFVVCGGTKIAPEDMQEYANVLARCEDRFWQVESCGEKMEIERCGGNAVDQRR
jgi:L-serine/L-threonine ammonia-lyase